MDFENEICDNEEEVLYFCDKGIEILSNVEEENEIQELSIEDWISQNHDIFLNIYFDHLKEQQSLFQKLTYNDWIDYIIGSHQYLEESYIEPHYTFFEFYITHKNIIDFLWKKIKTYKTIDHVCFPYFVEFCYIFSY